MLLRARLLVALLGAASSLSIPKARHTRRVGGRRDAGATADRAPAVAAPRRAGAAAAPAAALRRRVAVPGAAAAAAAGVAARAAALDGPPLAGAAPAVYEPRGITAVDSVVFLVGTAPFLWAAWEFWRRIAVGAGFGTGSDSVVIRDGEAGGADEDQVRRFGGRRVLGADAIFAARALMAVAAGSVALALVAAAQVLR